MTSKVVRTLDSGIDVKQGIYVGPGKFGNKIKLELVLTYCKKREKTQKLINVGPTSILESRVAMHTRPNFYIMYTRVLISSKIMFTSSVKVDRLILFLKRALPFIYVKCSELVFPCDVRISDVIWKNQQNFLCQSGNFLCQTTYFAKVTT